MTHKLFAATCYMIIIYFLVIACKAKPGEPSTNKQTPAVSAPVAMSSDIKSEQFLRDAALKDIDGDTAESFARQNGHTAVADLLKAK